MSIVSNKTIAAAAIAFALAGALSAPAAAQSADARKYVTLNPAIGFADTLKAARDLKARATLHLRSGASITGTVAGVGDHYVVLARLNQRDFYDAMIRIEDISGIEVRARDK
jgi:hypothetical protein